MIEVNKTIRSIKCNNRTNNQGLLKARVNRWVFKADLKTEIEQY